ncbi:oxygenase MpaB family protein [Enteractinococcus coprophilus]|uniref:Uncharacterized protein (DUF2236 family) n=1 Tax=Enteractinococcus coprophilus TaxID=1027633 RepID=A0A543ANI7_9MICC|nr:oxygenase MpaB family protein [Enteractinococcus coprophilus]TQL74142.1 uncharacterized protein (DUF2236 family) [Enteractinococcus coprophilus]
MTASSPRTNVQLAREGIILAGAGAAIGLQVAHRSVAAGVQQHSNFTADPLGRLRRTLQYIFAVVLPEAQPARGTVIDWVARAHVPVEGVVDGAPYSAADPQTQRWVTATLYWTAEQIRWRIWGERLAADDAEQIYRSYAVLGTALGMPEASWPEDRASFQRYWDQQMSTLQVTAVGRQIMTDLFAAHSVPTWLRAAMPLARFLTAGLLPADIRCQLGWDWDGAKSIREDRLWRILRYAYPRLPTGIRYAPARIVVAGLPAVSRD